MTPVIPSLTSSTLLIPGVTITGRKNNGLTSCYSLRKYTKQTSYAKQLSFPLSTSVILFPHLRTCGLHFKQKIQIVSATETDVAIEEPDSPVADKDSGEGVGISSVVETEGVSVKEDVSPAQAQSRRTRSVRKSEMPPVKDEELVPGATFTGKVRSIQPFGAFVDFGAFTDGLVHVSRLSDSFVKDVGTVVSIGQEVTVRLVESNRETGRISLTMRDSDDISKLQQPPWDSDRTRPPRRNTQKSNQRREEGKRTSKFVKGQDLEGKVKNLTRAGAFISLPEGEEGFLPISEEADDGMGNIMGGSSLQVDQEVSVRVLRVTRGQINLTMKKEEDVGELDSKLTPGTIHTATNPFLLAFRKNKDIAAFLDEREKDEDSPEESGSSINVPSATSETVEDDEISQDEVDVGAGITVDNENQDAENTVSDSLQTEDAAVQSIEEEAEANSGILDPDGSVSSSDQIAKAAPAIEVENGESEAMITKNEAQMETLSVESEISVPTPVENEKVKINPDESSSSTSLTVEVQSGESETTAKDEAQIKIIGPESEVSAPAPVENEKVEFNPDESSSSTSSTVEIENEESDETIAKDEAQMKTLSMESETSAPTPVENEKLELKPADSEIPSAKPAEGSNVEIIPEQNGSINNSNGQSSASPPKENTAKAAISPALVKQLRDETGAGMMDCKKALIETDGDIVKAQEYLRKKGLASADKKASRATAEGRIGSYIHDGRIGILVEVNCETDFVSRGDIFKELVDDLAMQVAACPQVEYIDTEDVPKETVEKEKAIEMQKEDLLSRPEQIRSKIVEGRIRKRLEELALLEQPYIKNDKVMVKDLVKQTIATIGENMKVKRFVRFNLGEGLEKKSQDFAAEVAAQTAAKQVSTPAKEQPAAAETNGNDEKPPKATVSAALVKQLREETGAGMMDCKKALAETGGDLEKAQEYLRKKGLSSADKKSSRLAAEGRIGSYIHDSRIGVLIEVNCETDFVGRSEKFKELVDDLAMQVVASPQVEYVSVEDVPTSTISKEKELEMQREDILSKPENIRERIVEGRVSKRLGELALLEQPFIKNDSMLVKDMVKQTVAALGENIKVRRFVRFTLGEASDEKT